MPYIERKDGNIVGIFPSPRHGNNLEFLEETDAEVVDFRNRDTLDPPTPLDDLLTLSRTNPDTTPQEKNDARARINGRPKPPQGGGP